MLLLLLLWSCTAGSPDAEEPLRWEQGAIALTPPSSTVSAGETVTLSATLTSRADGSTATPGWHLDGGALTHDGGTATWTAPWVPGTYHVTARSPEDADLLATAEITVTQQLPELAPLFEAPGIESPLEVVWLGSSGQMAYWLGDRAVFRDWQGTLAIILPSSCPPAPGPQSGLVLCVPGRGTAILQRLPTQGYDTLYVRQQQGDDTPTRAAVDDSGNFVASAEGSAITVRDTRDGLVIATHDAGAAVEALQWRPKSGLLGFVADGRLSLWNPGTDEVVDVGATTGRVQWDFDGAYVVYLDDGDAVWRGVEDDLTIRIPGDGDDIVGAVTNWHLDDDIIVAHASGKLRRIDRDTTQELWSYDLGEPAELLWHTPYNEVWVWFAGEARVVDTISGGLW